MAGNDPTRTSDAPGGEGHEDTIRASDPPEEELAPARRSIRPSIPPQATERYRLGAELGRGGMGRVVEAYDVQLGRTVALKEVLPRANSQGTARRFAREVQLTARLEHPSIVPLYDSGINAEGRPFYVMRRVSGRPLDELMNRTRELGERLTLLPALLAAIDAVAHAHRRGVIHRDLKPANILVGELGETVVIDWGLAKVIGEEDDDTGARIPSAADSLQTQVGSVFGTPGFMAPEQARGEELGAQGDVYALGATLYQLLAGTPPHAGNSATEVIDKTLRHTIAPLGEVAPGAPAELVAIVDKALAHESERRYPDAGALGEDVRRFLAGQLVAAHRYTPAQRVVRFARRHRAVLAVAALALVAVAVLAWIGVARIMTERDAATRARGEAVAGREAAEHAHARLADRHDALIVAQARALLDANPTEAAAILKQLSPSSSRIEEARALAQAAAVRGIAWAVQSTAVPTTVAELSPDSKRLLQVSRDGMVRVWDLERRRLMLIRTYAPRTRSLWVAGGRVLVTPEATAPLLLDPETNSAEPLPLDPISRAHATERGDRVLFTTSSPPGAGVLDVASREVTAVAAGKPIEGIAIAPDGSWLAVADGEAVVVLDAHGRELARRAVTATRLVISRTRALAVLAENQVVECRLDPRPVWTEVPFAVPANRFITDLIYRGDELLVYVAGQVLAWNGKTAAPRLTFDGMRFAMTVAGDDTLLVASPDGRIHFASRLARGSFALPRTVANLRIVTRPGSSRVIAIGTGIIVAFDLVPIVPRRVPVSAGAKGWFVDDRTLLVADDRELAWTWLDVTTGSTSKLAHRLHGFPEVWDIDSLTGRVLIRDTFGGAGGDPVTRLVLVKAGTSTARVIAEGEDAWGRLIAGDAVVYGVGDGRVFGQIGAEVPRELVKVEGKAEAAVSLGHLRFAVRSSSGEVVRGELAGNAIERTRVPVGASGFIAADATGRVVLADDNRVMVWGNDITELVRFDQPVLRIAPVDGGLMFVLQDLEVHTLEMQAGARPHRVLATTTGGAIASADGKLVVGTGAAMQLTIVEMPARARWTLPVLYTGAPGAGIFAISSRSRYVVQSVDRALAVWELPRASQDLGVWLDDQTNATIDADGVLAWPWQARGP